MLQWGPDAPGTLLPGVGPSLPACQLPGSLPQDPLDKQSRQYVTLSASQSQEWRNDVIIPVLEVFLDPVGRRSHGAGKGFLEPVLVFSVR